MARTAARLPAPRARKTLEGDDSTVPPGFTLERQITKHGETITRWRCGEISRHPVTGEWRRCSRYLQKNRCLAHKTRGDHEFHISRADDPAFPTDFDERHQTIGLQRGFDRLEAAEARFVARANLPAREADRDALHDFVQEIAQTVIELHRTSPRFQTSSIPHFSSTRLTRRMRREGAEIFEQMLDDIAQRIHYVNLVTDAGTVLGFNALHAIVLNPHYPDDLLPFDTYENCNYTSDDYEEFFKAMISQIREHGLELVAIICDNCPAQVNGAWQSMAYFPELAISHIPCLNHMVNLVFTHVLDCPFVAQRIAVLNDIIHDLRSPEGITILGRQCPTIVKTRWVYAVDVLHFVLQDEDDVNTIRATFDHPPIPQTLKMLYRMLLPLKLFSETMETRGRKLYDVIPVSHETLRQFRSVRNVISDDEDLDIFDAITAHFIARLKANSFPTIVTAWTLSHHGRQYLRAEEKDFLTRFNPAGGHRIPSVDCVVDLQKAFRERFTPWNQNPMIADPDSVSGFNPDNLVPIRENGDSLISDPVGDPSTRVAQYRAMITDFLTKQQELTPIERINQRLDHGAFLIACTEIQAQANSLELPYAANIVNCFRNWLFTRDVSDAPTDPDCHWREVHALGPLWTDLARIGLRYTAIGTSEADVERVIGEQKQIQGSFGVNFGTETLHARLVLRHQHHA